MQKQTIHDSDTGSGSNLIYDTTHTLNTYGQLVSATIADGKPRTVTYTILRQAQDSRELGQVIRRALRQAQGNRITRPTNAPAAQVGSPHEVWYRSGGRTLGQTGNNGSSDVDYATSIAQRTATPPLSPGTFAHGGTYASAHADPRLRGDRLRPEPERDQLLWPGLGGRWLHRAIWRYAGRHSARPLWRCRRACCHARAPLTSAPRAVSA
ncbi:MAG: hypothetical protein ABL909_03670 [Sphingopyxis sp.]